MTAEGRSIPYFLLEVIGGAGEALSPRDYFGEAYASGGAADLTEFTFVGVGDKFRGIGGEDLSQINLDGALGETVLEHRWGLRAAPQALGCLLNPANRNTGVVSDIDA